MTVSTYIGTSGWHYDHWVGAFYPQAAGPLKDLSIVFTGRLERWSRSDAEGLVEASGGRTSSNVSGNTDYVVAGPDAGSKVVEAKERDIPVVDEEEFARFLQDRGVDLSREE